MITLGDTTKAEYVDQNGFRRRVLLPAGVTSYSEGVPVSLDVDRLFEHCSIEFRRKLIDELWARDLVEPCDFLRPGAPELIRAAIAACVKVDTLNIVTLAHSECRR